jgi:hypothetical protein
MPKVSSGHCHEPDSPCTLHLVFEKKLYISGGSMGSSSTRSIFLLSLSRCFFRFALLVAMHFLNCLKSVLFAVT